MNQHDLEAMLRSARERGEAMLYTPPDGFRMIPEHAYPGAPLRLDELAEPPEASP